MQVERRELRADVSARIFVLEDDESLRLALLDNLEEEGYLVESASTLLEARAKLANLRPDLFILDIMLPDGDGYSFCRALRQEGHDGLVLMLTARTLEEDLLRGFEAGADDYLSKPYRLKELLARTQALLRRRGKVVEDRVRFDHFELDRAARRVRDQNGRDVELTKTEFDLLLLLLQERGRVLARDEILNRVWGENIVVDPRTVDNFVSSLKKKLGVTEGSAVRIQTVRGVGYRMELPEPAGGG